MRVIFIPVAGRPECAAALNTAFAFGHFVGASIVGCHIRPHSDSPVGLPFNLGLSMLSNEDFEWQAASKSKHGKNAGSAAKALLNVTVMILYATHAPGRALSGWKRPVRPTR